MERLEINPVANTRSYAFHVCKGVYFRELRSETVTFVYSGMLSNNLCTLSSTSSKSAPPTELPPTEPPPPKDVCSNPAAASSCSDLSAAVGEVAIVHAIPVMHRMADAPRAREALQDGISISSSMMVSAVAEPTGEYTTLP